MVLLQFLIEFVFAGEVAGWSGRTFYTGSFAPLQNLIVDLAHINYLSRLAVVSLVELVDFSVVLAEAISEAVKVVLKSTAHHQLDQILLSSGA